MKKIMKPSSTNGAFIREGDTVEFEVPHSTQTITVSIVEINMKSGKAVIHGACSKGHEYTISAERLIRVFNKKLTLKDVEKHFSKKEDK